MKTSINITINIDYSANYTIDLFDLKGVNLKTVFNGNLGLGDSNINYSIDYVSSGIYIIRITADNGLIKNIKFIKK